MRRYDSVPVGAAPCGSGALAVIVGPHPVGLHI
jgi:hypothetical protein